MTILNGGRPPAKRAGIVGDFYIDTRSHSIYGPKRTSGWGRPTQLIGPRGPAGASGGAGSNGAAGASGASGQGYAILNGSGPPGANIGADNDFYIDTAATQLYGPKKGGVWGSPISLTPGANLRTNNDGLVGATLADLALVTSANSGYSQSSGVLMMTSCRVDAAATRVAFEVDSPGSGLTPGQNFIGIYDTGGNLVAGTGDLSGTWGSGPVDKVIVLNLWQTLEPGAYYVGVLMNYTGSNTYLTGARCPMIPEIGTGFSPVPRACFSSGTYNTLPSSVNWSGDGFTSNPWDFVTFIGFLP